MASKVGIFSHPSGLIGFFSPTKPKAYVGRQTRTVKLTVKRVYSSHLLDYYPFSTGQKSHVNPPRSGFSVQWECVNSAFTPRSIDYTVGRFLSPRLGLDPNIRPG